MNKTADNIIYMDQIRMTGLIEKYYEGNLVFFDLWQSYLGHRGLGYHLIFLANAVFFDLNTLVEINLSALCLLLIAVIILKAYLESVSDMKHTKIFMISVLSILIVIFSLNKWEIALLGLGLNEFLPHVLLIFMFYIFNKLLIENKLGNVKKILLFLSLNLSLLLFSVGYLAPFFAAMYLIIILDCIIKCKTENIKNKLNIVVPYSINLGVLLVIYFYGINENINNESTMGLTDKIIGMLSNFGGVVQFYLYGLTGSIIGAETGSKLLTNNSLLVLGVIVFLMYILVIYLFFKNKIYKISYLPILLILYSMIYMCLITISRIDYGILYGTQSRYALAMMYALIGVIWILSIRIKINYSKKTLVSYGIVLALIISGIFLTSLDEIRKSPYRKLAYENMRADAYYLNMQNWQQYQSTEELTINAFEVLKENKLNVFSDYKGKVLNDIGTSIGQAKIQSGIYKEDNNYWLSKSSSIQIKSGPLGKAYLEGYMTDVFSNNLIVIFINGQEVYREELQPGQLKLEFSVTPNSVLEMNIILDKTYIPNDLDLSKDERELGILVNKFNIE